MGLLTQFTSPQDVRWQGSHRTHHVIFLTKSILLIPFIILVIVEYPLFKSWWEGGPYTHYDWQWAPYQFWFRIGLALIPDIVVTIVSLVLILNPMHRATYSFHPVFALVSSFILWALYVQACWLNPLIARANEVAFYNMDVWEKIVYAETAFQAIICILYFTMFVYGCIAVDRWRMAKKLAKKSEAVHMARLSGDGVGGSPA